MRKYIYSLTTLSIGLGLLLIFPLKATTNANNSNDLIFDNSFLLNQQIKHYMNFSISHIANFVYSAEMGEYEIVRAYIIEGMDVNAQDHNNDTALMGAALNGHPKILKLLIKLHANAYIKNDNGLSALDFAKLQERKNVLGVLQASSPTRNLASEGSSDSSWSD